MKKLAIVISVFLVSLSSTAQTFKEFYSANRILFDLSVDYGHSFAMSNSLVSFDLTAKGFMFGLGFTSEYDAEGSGNKSVYVSSYTRKQNGKNVNVKSYYRSKPNSGGGNVDLELHEVYFGFWLPSIKGKYILYATPIIGGYFGISTPLQTDNLLRFCWGGGIKIERNNIGLTLLSKNSSINIGLSVILH